MEALNSSIAELEKTKPAPLPVVQAIADPGPDAPPSYFLHRGSVLSKGSEMSPGAIAVLNPPGVDIEVAQAGAGREVPPDAVWRLLTGSPAIRIP